MAIAHDAVLSEDDETTPLEYRHENDVLRIYGFWLFIATDLVLFGTLFATYVVLRANTAGGPSESQLFEVPIFTAETLILLTSSFTCGLATFQMHRKKHGWLSFWLVVTVLLGATFIGLELSEFITYATHGATMQRSAFLSAFFTLVGTHGIHVSMGILWMLSILYQLWRTGLNSTTARKVFVVGLYWHFLDVVWVFIFTVVYLTGVAH